MNILLVDDDFEERRLFSDGIYELNLALTLLTAKNSIELFEWLERKLKINLIFLDINMPGLNGKECLQLLKADKDHRHIPVIMYSISKNIRDIDEVYEIGAHYYAVKPHADINLRETLKMIFSIDWTKKQPTALRDQFVINKAFI